MLDESILRDPIRVATVEDILSLKKSKGNLERIVQRVKRYIEILTLWEKLLEEYSTEIQSKEMSFKDIKRMIEHQLEKTKTYSTSYATINDIVSNYKLSVQIKLLKNLKEAHGQTELYK